MQLEDLRKQKTIKENKDKLNILFKTLGMVISNCKKNGWNVEVIVFIKSKRKKYVNALLELITENYQIN